MCYSDCRLEYEEFDNRNLVLKALKIFMRQGLS